MFGNYSYTNLIYLISSAVLGFDLNFTVLIKALSFWNYWCSLCAASISNTLSPRAIIFVIAYISNFLVTSKKARAFHSWYYPGSSRSNFDLADTISISVLKTSNVLGKNLYAESSTQPSAAFVIIITLPFSLAEINRFLTIRSISWHFLKISFGKGILGD